MKFLGSARNASPARTSLLAIASRRSPPFAEEDCFGETPKPTRETRALPRTDFVGKLPTNAG